jgi:hypothetical protein
MLNPWIFVAILVGFILWQNRLSIIDWIEWNFFTGTLVTEGNISDIYQQLEQVIGGYVEVKFDGTSIKVSKYELKSGSRIKFNDSEQQVSLMPNALSSGTFLYLEERQKLMEAAKN